MSSPVLSGGSDLRTLLETEPAPERVVADARASLATAGDHVVVLSSAVVYGAWPDNPVPLTEEAPLRPNPGFASATASAEVERLVLHWREEEPGRTAAVLRPAPSVAEGWTSWLARTVAPADHAQFLHLDDLASAVDLARTNRLDGAYNVAPAGWLEGDEARALTGRTPSFWARTEASRARFRAQNGGAYAEYPWVVANDRLAAAGWRAEHTNEEAAVAAFRPEAWTELSPHRRQQFALGGAGLLVAGAAAGTVAALRSISRRRRARGGQQR